MHVKQSNPDVGQKIPESRKFCKVTQWPKTASIQTLLANPTQDRQPTRECCWDESSSNQHRTQTKATVLESTTNTALFTFPKMRDPSPSHTAEDSREVMRGCKNLFETIACRHRSSANRWKCEI
ncbi:hypothetical protein TNIN_125211 [Trichonephila inaurata madagascariensis]|uniref:Uncharacterized protein n=1 Tax=Trichonephila inaurata madagascariensis TaxID=2747483 RepID=A0A8X6YTI5_9ARAC|nr:hypothetical protein TNIN_125211 [Trichonephila inaurata madagascariensis]